MTNGRSCAGWREPVDRRPVRRRLDQSNASGSQSARARGGAPFGGIADTSSRPMIGLRKINCRRSCRDRWPARYSPLRAAVETASRHWPDFARPARDTCNSLPPKSVAHRGGNPTAASSAFLHRQHYPPKPPAATRRREIPSTQRHVSCGGGLGHSRTRGRELARASWGAETGRDWHSAGMPLHPAGSRCQTNRRS